MFLIFYFFSFFVFKKGKNEEAIWFKFQKTKYIYNADKKSFEGLQFPENNPFKFYQEWKGFADEAELSAAESKYGKNE